MRKCRVSHCFKAIWRSGVRGTMQKPSQQQNFLVARVARPAQTILTSKTSVDFLAAVGKPNLVQERYLFARDSLLASNIQPLACSSSWTSVQRHAEVVRIM